MYTVVCFYVKGSNIKINVTPVPEMGVKLASVPLVLGGYTVLQYVTGSGRVTN